MGALEFAGRWTEDVARRRLAELDSSGMTLVAFAARLGVSTQRFVYWRDRLQRAAPAPGPRFVELAVREPPRSTPAMEVRFPSGHVVAVPAGAASLAEVLDLVEDLSC
jgi:hypothetical protein